MRTRTACVGIVSLCLAACVAELEPDNTERIGETFDGFGPTVEFEAQYVDCDEFAGVGVVPIENVIGRVPSDYTVSEPIPGSAVVVAQAGSCTEIATGGHRKPAIFAQFGVAVVPPGGSASGDFYQLMFATNHPKLAKHMGKVANAAETALIYDITEIAANEASLHITVPEPSALAWDLDGPITLPDPTSPPGPVSTFNYWSQSDTKGNVLQENVVTGIRVGEGTGVWLTPIGSEMQAIVGAPILVFPFFSKPEVFDVADLTVLSEAF